MSNHHRTRRPPPCSKALSTTVMLPAWLTADLRISRSCELPFTLKTGFAVFGTRTGSLNDAPAPVDRA